MAHKALRQVAHRPWPIPDRPWRMQQRWKNLLFAHWPVPRVMLEPLVPDRLKIQEFNGNAWIGIVPFEMDNIAWRPFPPLPGLSSFPELNLRLYVEYNGKPGVWFLSLDAANAIAVQIARFFFNLPYFTADMSVDSSGEKIRFESQRSSGEEEVSFEAKYEPDSEQYFARGGTLEKWLTERYCLYSQSSNGSLYRTEIHHLPWQLQKAKADIAVNELPNPFNIALPEQSPILHFSKELDVIIWTPDKLE